MSEVHCWGCAHGVERYEDQETGCTMHGEWSFGPQHEFGRAYLVHHCLTVIQSEHEEMWRDDAARTPTPESEQP